MSDKYNGAGLWRGVASLLMAIFCLASTAQADKLSSPRFTLPYIGGNAGLAEVREPSGFTDSGALNSYAGFYVFKDLSLELWMAYLGKFDVKGLRDSYTESSGMGTTVAYRFDINKLFALRPSVGVFYSESEVTLEGRRIGEDNATDVMYALTGVFTIKEHVLVNVNTHLFNNVSGGDILLFSVGAGYQF